MNKELLLAVAILLPALSSILCYILRKAAVRNFIVVVTTLVLFAVAGGFVYLMAQSDGKLVYHLESLHLDWVIKGLDILLLTYVAYIGIKLRKPVIFALAVLQFIPFFLFEIFHVFGTVKEPESAFVIDYLSLVMILLVSVIGPIITVFAIGYMKDHEHHSGLKKSRQPRFFFILFIFLAAMNALVMTNNLAWMYLFWEITTLCSFLLISHDGNTQSVNNAARALWINSLGGLAFICGIIAIYMATGTLAIDQIVANKTVTEFAYLLPFGLSLLCFAGFTKSAQFPFQSWLLGAMVAPTPVSALLHSSTMVKAGVYLVVRMAPAFSGTLLGKIVAVVGGFTFLAGSAIAISQRNGKRVLAYSTIANLGLIVCCAGIGTYVALGAAVLLIIFHAVSKGLLFLCVGTIEHGIGSRDIEDMQGLMKKMPFTTVITVIGMISMLLPPFGVLITKWLAIESAVNSPIVLMSIILGSAFTVVFWSKWIGIILTMSYKPKYNVEKLTFSVKSSLIFLIAGVLAASILIVPMFNGLIKPYLSGLTIANEPLLGGDSLGVVLQGANSAVVGGFASILFFAIVFVLIITIPYFLRRTKPEKVKPPYLCGENINNDLRGIEFISPGDKVDNVIVQNYYLSGIFGEDKLTLWTNLVAGAIIIIMFGVVIG
ncbi:MAG: NADH-quinone oxidoreductase subunit L [Clostridia bacterium]|nr:NADH-quinone oxidoreductase subunit L [Clostridia bacterium]